MKYCIGIDIGGTSVKLGIMRADGALLRKWEIPTRHGENGAWMFSDIAAALRQALREEGLAAADIAGAGVGIPGPVMPNGYVDVCVNLGIHSCYPARELSERLNGMRVRVANDANVAALGEMWQGAGKGQHSICMVTLGTGVGGGIVNEAQIIAGTHGAGGEIGHMHVLDGEPEACNCGGHGCLEQYASATGIVRVAKRKLKASSAPSSLRAFHGTFSAKAVCDAAKAGDALALEALRFSMDQLGLILSHVSLCTDPKLFVIGGGVSKAGSFLIDLIEQSLRKHTHLFCEKAPMVVQAALGNDAGIYGAARMMLEAEAASGDGAERA